jgi:hypothetical protein
VAIADSTFELATLFSASASASFSTLGGGGSGYFNMSKQFKQTSHSFYLAITVKVLNSPVGMESYMLTEPARKHANNLTPPEFYKRYGDRFVEGITTGGELQAVVEIISDSAAQRDETKAGVEGGAGSFHAAADMASYLQTVSTTTKTKVAILKQGGSPEITDINGLIEEAKKFPTEIADRSADGKDRSVVCFVNLQDYSSAANWPDGVPTPPSTSEALAELDRLKVQRIDLINLGRDASDIEEDPDDYIGASEDFLKRYNQSRLDAIDEVDARAKKIIDNPLAPIGLKKDYVAALKPLPELKLLSSVGLAVEVRSSGVRGDVNRWEVNRSGEYVGTDRLWIEASNIKRNFYTSRATRTLSPTSPTGLTVGGLARLVGAITSRYSR